MAKKDNTLNKNESFKNPPQTLKDHPFYGLILDEQQTKFRDAIWDPEKLIIFANSRAGTGKTMLAVATANLLVEYGRYDGIVFIVSPTQEQKLGFLPGSVEQKTEPYFEPLYQALIKLNINPDIVINQANVMNQKNGTGYIDALTHVYLRGYNFENKIVILEESQNYDFESLKKTITRVHDNCKLIIIGHHKQCDIYNETYREGFIEYLEHFKKSNDNRVAVCELTKNYRGWISTYADELE